MSSRTVPAVPEIIQGGMGVYISSPFLANVVSRNGGLGTVSGVMPERILARILGRGDIGGHYRRALSNFPFPRVSKQVLDAFYIEEHNPKGVSLREAPFFTVNPSALLIALSICANYAFVYLAKEGHENPVSINYLEKIAMPHIYAITGAMLAGVDFITMGAGIPLQIPEVINALAVGKTAEYRIPVTGLNITSHTMSFNPGDFFREKIPPLKKPGFIPIIASNLLASIFMKKLPEGSVYGFVVEEPTAGGHNAPPRKGDVYSSRDEVDYEGIAKFGLPFWIGGSKASPEKLRWAKSVGATGIQAGSIFALCEESGMDPLIRKKVRALGFNGSIEIRTDRKVSPTGFPFKVVVLPESLSEEGVYLARSRACPHGALRTLFEGPDGSIGYRCPGEPVGAYVRKLGKVEETAGARCLCSGLMATASLGGGDEPPVITMGDDVGFLTSLMSSAEDSHGVIEALGYLRG
jgi:NAD(P)H-dependent flavin oxidoreductase YrpB (nitropropane dioxygenase family)